MLNPERLPELFHDTIKRWHGRTHYRYQVKIADAILRAVIDAAEGKTSEIPVELPRQSGKTTTIVDLVEVLIAVSQRYFKRPIAIGVFAPEIEQATTDFDRLKMQFTAVAGLGFTTRVKTDGELKIPEKWNSKTIRIFSKNGKHLGEVYIFPISKHSNPESKTLDIAIIEEAQDVYDEKMKNAIFPMVASTNGPRIYVGTAGTRNCYFKSQLDNNPKRIIIPLEEVLADRRAMAEETGDAYHLRYERFVEHEIATHGNDSDYIQRQFRLKWKIGSGQFTTPEILDSLVHPDFGIISENTPEYERDEKGEIKKHRDTGELKVKREPYACFGGLDTAKAPDQTVATVIRETDEKKLVEFAAEAKKKIQELLKHEEESGNTALTAISEGGVEIRSGTIGQLCNWVALKGTNYEDQFDILKKFFSQYENLKAIAIDSTGQGDFMPDKFERHTSWNIIRVKFSAESKDSLYKILDQVIKNALTVIPNAPMDSNYRAFFREVIELEKEYKGQFLAVHHPERNAEGKPGHDDYPDSWALAEYARFQVKRTEPGLTFI